MRNSSLPQKSARISKIYLRHAPSKHIRAILTGGELSGVSWVWAWGWGSGFPHRPSCPCPPDRFPSFTGFSLSPDDMGCAWTKPSLCGIMKPRKGIRWDICLPLAGTGRVGSCRLWSVIPEPRPSVKPLCKPFAAGSSILIEKQTPWLDRHWLVNPRNSAWKSNQEPSRFLLSHFGLSGALGKTLGEHLDTVRWGYQLETCPTWLRFFLSSISALSLCGKWLSCRGWGLSPHGVATPTSPRREGGLWCITAYKLEVPPLECRSAFRPDGFGRKISL